MIHVIPFLSLAGILLFNSVFAQTKTNCVKPQQRSFPEGYQDYSDRCEGLYGQEVSGTPLAVVGLAQTLGDIKWGAVPKLILTWEAPPQQDVQLTALSIDPQVLYRMDSFRPATSGGRFQWNTALLDRIRLNSGSLALSLWYRGGLSPNHIYVPLHMQAGGERLSGPVELVLYPGVDLKDCLVTLQGESGPPIWKNHPLPQRAFPREAPIRIPLDVGLKPGLYRFEAVAHMQDGGTTKTEAITIRIP